MFDSSFASRFKSSITAHNHNAHLQRAGVQDVVHRLLVGERHKAEAAGPPALVVVHHHGVVHRAKLLEVLLQRRLVNGRREAADKHLSGAPRW